MRRASIIGLIAATALLVACRRERREFRQAPPAATAQAVAVRLEENAFALSEGKRLFGAFNCTGCHANGGGGIGPALMDDVWFYGYGADQIYRSILEGRPNGMPSYRGKIADAQMWQIAAYVRSLSGFAPKDAATSRSDHMSGPPPENATTKQQPKIAR